MAIMGKGTKRNHLVPRYYLGGFTCPGSDKKLCQFDRDKDEPIITTIVNAGVQNDFYTLDEPDGTRDRITVESWLSEEIEGSAHAAIRKVRNFQPIDQSERDALARYMSVMPTRGDWHWQHAAQIAPKVAAEMHVELDKELDQQAAARHSADKAFVEERRKLIHEIVESIAADPPSEVLMPRDMRGVEAVLGMMTWRFLHREGEPCFITSDNPVYTDLGVGLRHPRTEVLFPISKTILLWATWYEQYEHIPRKFRSGLRRSPNRPEGFWLCSKRMVKNANRLIVRNATRFVWAWTGQSWIQKLLTQPRVNEPTSESQG
jgi:Protein of unknown function (DUF4238)